MHDNVPVLNLPVCPFPFASFATFCSTLSRYSARPHFSRPLRAAPSFCPPFFCHIPSCLAPPTPRRLKPVLQPPPILCLSPLTPHPSPLTPHPSLLTPHHSPLTLTKSVYRSRPTAKNPPIFSKFPTPRPIPFPPTSFRRLCLIVFTSTHNDLRQSASPNTPQLRTRTPVG